jgi:predicted DNA-binding transcriptional regulator YafY
LRRADRLFQIIQLLRGAARPVTASQLASELEVSVRSVYRDMADLMAQRVPIRGEAGLGYVLGREFDMPPLMLTPEEIEAVSLGAQWVTERADPTLAAAARGLLAKIAAVMPDELRTFVTEPTTGAPPALGSVADGLDLARVRACIRQGGKVRIGYRDEAGRESCRTIWPVVIGYTETVRLLGAWCEERRAFRHFRTDRIVTAEFMGERHALRPAVLREQWQRHYALERLVGG